LFTPAIQARLVRRIRVLAPLEKQVLELHYVEDMPLLLIAKNLGIDRQEVHSIYHCALYVLRPNVCGEVVPAQPRTATEAREDAMGWRPVKGADVYHTPIPPEDAALVAVIKEELTKILEDETLCEPVSASERVDKDGRPLDPDEVLARAIGLRRYGDLVARLEDAWYEENVLKSPSSLDVFGDVQSRFEAHGPCE